MEREIFLIEFQHRKISADIIPKGTQPEILFLHGAGISDKTIFNTFRELLAEEGISSCAFDFIGYGETGGLVEESSLKGRTLQTMAVIEACNLKKPLVIFGGSMSGYNAIKLTESLPVKALILSAPAVYDRDAYTVHFGESFSAIIRKPESWQNTDAWEILEKYTGKILILSAGKDTIIPAEVITSIYNHSPNATYREIMHIPNAPHRLASYLQENQGQLELVVEKVVSILK